MTFVAADSTVDEKTGIRFFRSRDRAQGPAQDAEGGEVVSAGMVGQSYIHGERRTFASYLLSPLTDSLKNELQGTLMTDPKPLSPMLASLALLLATMPASAETELGPFKLRGFIDPEETSLPAELPAAEPVMAQSQPTLGRRGVSRFVFPVMDPPSLQTASIPARPTMAQRGAPRLALMPRESMTDATILVHEAIDRSDKLRSAQHEVYAARARVWKAWSGYVRWSRARSGLAEIPTQRRI